MSTLSNLARVFALFFVFSAPAFALDPIYSDFFGKAIKGYDPVAYFTESKPVKGDSDYQVEWNGADWYFASEANKQAFLADPEKYAPQYGGYCAWAVSQGYTAKIDPDAWRIHQGKLYLNYNASIQKRWEQNIPGNVTKGDRNWPTLVSAN